MHAISSYRGKRHRPLARRPPVRHRQDRLQYTAPQLASAQCNNNIQQCQCTRGRVCSFRVAERSVRKTSCTAPGTTARTSAASSSQRRVASTMPRPRPPEARPSWRRREKTETAASRWPRRTSIKSTARAALIRVHSTACTFYKLRSVGAKFRKL